MCCGREPNNFRRTRPFARRWISCPNVNQSEHLSAMTTNSPLISACIIAKNEEKNLGRCLTSLHASVDEIIVVDTGSTDRTVEIARAHGARVFNFPWCDHFSAARNESLSHAGGRWIIWIDADDELIEAAPRALRKL